MDETRIETENETGRRSATETRGWMREALGLALVLVGAAGGVVCLVHLGWWFSGLILASFLTCAGTVSILHRDETRVEIENQRDDLGE